MHQQTRPGSISLSSKTSLSLTFVSKIHGNRIRSRRLGDGQKRGRLRSKFVSEVLLCFSEIELVNQEEFASVALLEFADQKRVQGTSELDPGGARISTGFAGRL